MASSIGDVDGVPAGLSRADAGCVAAARAPACVTPGDAFAGAALDAAELLDVDVDQLARPLALVAHRGLEAEAAELAHPDRA